MARRGCKELYKALEDVRNTLHNLYYEVQDKMDEIDDKTMEYDRDYTDHEQEIMDAYDNVQTNIVDAVSSIDEALCELE